MLLIGAVIAAVVLTLLLYRAWGDVTAAEAARAAAERAEASAWEERDKAFAALAEKRRSEASLRDELALEKRRADEYFALIEGVVREATDARGLYQRMAVQHGNAQAIMMNQIASLGRQYLSLVDDYRKQVGRPPRLPDPIVDPIVKQVATEFREQHIGGTLEMPSTAAAAEVASATPAGAPPQS